MKKKKSIKAKIVDSIFVLLGSLMVLAGLAIFFFNSRVGRAYVVRDNGEQVSQHLTAKQADANKKKKTNYDASKTTEVDTQSLWSAKNYPAYAIGRMSIPAADIHNPVFQGYGDHNQNLSYGVVTVVQGRTLGGINNMVYAGHYMGGYGPAVLDNLYLTKAGDSIYVTDMHKIYEYTEKTMSYNITPKQIEVENNIPGKRSITLITCSDFNVNKYGYGQHRTVAMGELSHVYPATKKNLVKYELTDNDKQNKQSQSKKTTPKKNKVRESIKKTQPVTASIYSKFSLKKIIIITLSVFGIIIMIMLIRIWL